jgi:hypothetical protein
MKFDVSDLRKIFDIQVHRLFDLFDKQITAFQSKWPADRIAHLVLSGGLGNNEYVQSRLNDRYAFGASPFQCARNIKVSVATDPQLCVCKGMITDRLRKLQSGKAVLGWRCCRASYGTTCKVRYDMNNQSHVGQSTTLDPLDNTYYITDTIAWFIKKVSDLSPTLTISALIRIHLRENQSMLTRLSATSSIRN